MVLADDRDIVDLNLGSESSRQTIDHGYTMTVAAEHAWGGLLLGKGCCSARASGSAVLLVLLLVAMAHLLVRLGGSDTKAKSE